MGGVRDSSWRQEATLSAGWGGELTTGLTFPLGRQDLGGDDSSRPSLIFLWEETFDGRWRQRLIALHWELTQLL